jgi:hypothetical protein
METENETIGEQIMKLLNEGKVDNVVYFDKYYNPEKRYQREELYRGIRIRVSNRMTHGEKYMRLAEIFIQRAKEEIDKDYENGKVPFQSEKNAPEKTD